MLSRLIAIVVISLNFNYMSANPIEIHKSNKLSVLSSQLFNNSNLLVYQEYKLNEDQQSGEVRKRRFLDDLIYLYNFFANYGDDEDDSSSEEEDDSSNEKEDSKDGSVSDLCRNCSVIVNKIQQIQHIQQNVAPSRAPVNDIQNSTTTIQEPMKTQTPYNIEIVKDDITTKATSIALTETSATITANIPTIASTGAPATTATNGPTEVTTEATGTEETLDKTKVLTESSSEFAVAEEATSEALAEDKTPAASETTDTSKIPVEITVTTEPSTAVPVAEEATSEALADDNAPAEAETIGNSEVPVGQTQII